MLSVLAGMPPLEERRHDDMNEKVACFPKKDGSTLF